MQIACGTLVVITAGKYKGLVMAVTDTDSAYVYVADGRHRKQEHTKKFNPKHVLPLGLKISAEEMKTVTDKMLWKRIKQMSVDIKKD